MFPVKGERGSTTWCWLNDGGASVSTVEGEAPRAITLSISAGSRGCGRWARNGICIHLHGLHMRVSESTGSSEPAPDGGCPRRWYVEIDVGGELLWSASKNVVQKQGARIDLLPLALKSAPAAGCGLQALALAPMLPRLSHYPDSLALPRLSRLQFWQSLSPIGLALFHIQLIELLWSSKCTPYSNCARARALPFNAFPRRSAIMFVHSPPPARIPSPCGTLR